MPPKKQDTVWPAKPHTIAKIAILEGYLKAWFPMLGRRARGVDLLYIDGFAGPGRYTNHPTGSPVAALRSATKAVQGAGANWRAGVVHLVFIEVERDRFQHLDQHLEPFRTLPGIQIHMLNSAFVDGIAKLESEMPAWFSTNRPMFAFIDPFGAKGVPFSSVARLLSSPASEVLINLDADSIIRIHDAGEHANHRAILNSIFGDDSWETLLEPSTIFSERCRSVLALYMARLRSLQDIRYVFPFEMRKSTGTLEYYLIFASRHPRGLEKMKEAMRQIDQTGEYQFCDAHVGQQMLFQYDDPLAFAKKMHQRFSGTATTYEEVRDYALNETPFPNPKSMLKVLEKCGGIRVFSINPRRRRGTFAEGSISSIVFS